MEKAEWLLLDEIEKIQRLGQWIDRLLILDNENPRNVFEKKQLERYVFNVIEWLKDFGDD